MKRRRCRSVGNLHRRGGIEWRIDTSWQKERIAQWLCIIAVFLVVMPALAAIPAIHPGVAVQHIARMPASQAQPVQWGKLGQWERLGRPERPGRLEQPGRRARLAAPEDPLERRGRLAPLALQARRGLRA